MYRIGRWAQIPGEEPAPPSDCGTIIDTRYVTVYVQIILPRPHYKCWTRYLLCGIINIVNPFNYYIGGKKYGG